MAAHSPAKLVKVTQYGITVYLVTLNRVEVGQVLQVNGGLTLRRNPTSREITASLKAAAARPDSG